MTIVADTERSGSVAYFARCPRCLFVSEPYGDAAAARVLGVLHACD